jgi:hypothetical protein
MYQIDVTTDRTSAVIRPDFMDGCRRATGLRPFEPSPAERLILEFRENACRMSIRAYIPAIMSVRVTQHTRFCRPDGPKAQTTGDLNICDPECIILNG